MKKRHGFTMIEMLVATALTLFLMVIVAQAFVTALDTFTNLKAIGDMQEGLRTATTNLRFDLQQDHFEGKRRLSDASLVNPPIREGFFAIYQGGASVLEGVDNDLGIPSYLASNDVLHFTVKLRGNRREDFFAATAGPLLFPPQQTNYFNQLPDALYQQNNFHSSWAEVAYYLVPTGTTANPFALGGGGTPLYALFRSQFVVVPAPQAVNTFATTNKVPWSVQYQNIASNPGSNGYLYCFSPNDLASSATPRLRTISHSNPQYPRGATRVVSNVVSFDIRILIPGALEFSDLPAPIYDSSAAPFPINALQISIRVWDQKTQQARQITIIQDM